MPKLFLKSRNKSEGKDKSVMLERLLQLKEDWRRLHTQVVSTTALATTLYTASALDREVVACRLDDQEGNKIIPQKHTIA
ncbi:unnamed protein product [Cuscuta campestris]|uniref:Uncharacterized protein n=1 Tax=Cuscuta campestris TaxID=132261 RepID=A0A484N7X4_9ASTE|nr:unnamed protein product [Cuscuta campestris]